MAKATQLAAMGRPTEETLAALREATIPSLPRSRAIALLKRGRGEVSWAANFYWEDTEAHAEEAEDENSVFWQDTEAHAEEADEDDVWGSGLGEVDSSDGSRTPEHNFFGPGMTGTAAGGFGAQAGAGASAGSNTLASTGSSAGAGIGANAALPAAANWPGAPSGGVDHAPQPLLPAAVDPGTINATQISQLQEVTKENLSEDQMRALLAKSGGHVNIAVELYFADFDAAKKDLLKRGLPVHTDRSPQRKRLSADALKEQEETYARVVNGEDDDIEIVGTKTDTALVAMPHARCSCPTVHFIVLPEKEASEKVRSTNIKTCDKCYCWVCDVLASECNEWSRHCMAFDRDPTWKKLRAEKKSQAGASTVASAGAAGASGRTGGTGAAAAAAGATDPDKPKPLCTLPGWTVAWSSEHREWFFWNAQTKVSTWNPPQK